MGKLGKYRKDLDELSKEVERYMKEDFLKDFQKKLFSRLNIKDIPSLVTLVMGQDDIVKVMREIINDLREEDEIYCMANKFNLIKHLTGNILNNNEKISKFHIILSGEEGRKEDILRQLEGFNPEKLDVKYLPREVIGDMRVMLNKSEGTFGIKFQAKGYVGVKNVESKDLMELFNNYYNSAKNDPWIARWEHPPKKISPKEIASQLDTLLTKLREYKGKQSKYLYLALNKARFLVDDEELLGKLKKIKKQGILLKIILSKDAKETYKKLSNFKFDDNIILSDKITNHRYVICNIIATDILDNEFNQNLYLLLYDSSKETIEEMKNFIEKVYIKR